MRPKRKTLDDDWGFDRLYYIRTNPDVIISGHDPRQHYMEFGWREARDPSDYFSTTGYLEANPDVAASQVNPLIHFQEHGVTEGRGGWRKRGPEDWTALAASELHALQKQVIELRLLLGTNLDADPDPASSIQKLNARMTPRAARIRNQFLKTSSSTLVG